VGSCEDREERLRRHNAGDTKATKHGIPWSLIHSEAFSTRGEATARERYYKTGRGRDELDSFLYRAVAAATGRRFKSCRPDRPSHSCFTVMSCEAKRQDGRMWGRAKTEKSAYAGIMQETPRQPGMVSHGP